MGRFLILWEMNQARIPVDPQERAAGWGILTELVKQDLQKGRLKEWGTFVGSNGGFAIGEGTEVELAVALQQYIPFVTFKTYPIMSLEQAGEVLKSLSPQIR